MRGFGDGGRHGLGGGLVEFVVELVVGFLEVVELVAGQELVADAAFVFATIRRAI